MAISNALRKELKRIGKIGGDKRWNGITKRKRRAHALMMVAARKRNGS